jgi:hypothetical protein
MEQEQAEEVAPLISVFSHLILCSSLLNGLVLHTYRRAHSLRLAASPLSHR